MHGTEVVTESYNPDSQVKRERERKSKLDLAWASYVLQGNTHSNKAIPPIILK